jgi:predicted ArsR family transcriptional regulator
MLKLGGPLTASEVARRLAMTVPGARKHLAGMRDRGLLQTFDESVGVGRPRRFWSLAQAADSRFPDTHAVLTVELIAAMRKLFGRDGLDRLIGERESQTLGRYRDAMIELHDPESRVERLAQLRSAEGYMAEWSRDGHGGWLLVENHCPICAAARSCQDFCRSELEVFRAALGAGVEIERAEHMLSGSRRCAYRILPVPVIPK